MIFESFGRREQPNSSASRYIVHTQFEEVSGVASQQIRNLLAGAVVLFGLLGAWLLLALAIVYEWTWLALANWAVMNAAAGVAVWGWRKKSSRKVWLSGGMLICWLILLTFLQGA